MMCISIIIFLISSCLCNVVYDINQPYMNYASILFVNVSNVNIKCGKFGITSTIMNDNLSMTTNNSSLNHLIIRNVDDYDMFNFKSLCGINSYNLKYLQISANIKHIKNADIFDDCISICNSPNWCKIGLYTITELNLEKNRLKTINLSNFKFIKKIDVSHNPVNIIYPNKNISLQILRMININNGNVFNFNDSNMNNLSDVYARNNNYTQLGNIYTKTNIYIDLSNNYIKHLKPNILHDNPLLDLSNNCITDIEYFNILLYCDDDEYDGKHKLYSNLTKYNNNDIPNYLKVNHKCNKLYKNISNYIISGTTKCFINRPTNKVTQKSNCSIYSTNNNNDYNYNFCSFIKQVILNVTDYTYCNIRNDDNSNYSDDDDNNDEYINDYLNNYDDSSYDNYIYEGKITVIIVSILICISIIILVTVVWYNCRSIKKNVSLDNLISSNNVYDEIASTVSYEIPISDQAINENRNNQHMTTFGHNDHIYENNDHIYENDYTNNGYITMNRINK